MDMLIDREVQETMKKNQDDKLFIIAGIVSFVLIVILVWHFFLPSYSFSILSERAIVNFDYGTITIHKTVSEKDSELLKRIFIGKWYYIDEPSCGFDENISIEFNGDVYMPACDGDPIIKHGNKYSTITDEECDAMHIILKKYGFFFPCV